MTGTEQESAVAGEADVCVGQMSEGVEDVLWPKFGKALVDPAGGGKQVPESELTWLADLDR